MSFKSPLSLLTFCLAVLPITVSGVLKSSPGRCKPSGDSRVPKKLHQTDSARVTVREGHRCLVLPAPPFFQNPPTNSCTFWDAASSAAPCGRGWINSPSPQGRELINTAKRTVYFKNWKGSIFLTIPTAWTHRAWGLALWVRSTFARLMKRWAQVSGSPGDCQAISNRPRTDSFLVVVVLNRQKLPELSD